MSQARDGSDHTTRGAVQGRDFAPPLPLCACRLAARAAQRVRSPTSEVEALLERDLVSVDPARQHRLDVGRQTKRPSLLTEAVLDRAAPDDHVISALREEGVTDLAALDAERAVSSLVQDPDHLVRGRA